MRLEGVKPKISYFGLITEKQKDVVTQIEAEVFGCLVFWPRDMGLFLAPNVPLSKKH